VVILLDDIGFADTGTFGGIVETPALDALAADGVRYNNFNTAAMCSPTRAALLSGRNHHRVGFGLIADMAQGYPGYDSVWKESAASVAEVLRRNGYRTAAIGKWHNTPDWEITPTGPFDRWPTGLGFEYYYGFMGPEGADSQWEPSKLYRGTTPVEPWGTPEQGYHATSDFADEAVRWLERRRTFSPESPYFLYVATGATHTPHHAPREWIERYRGAFDDGWDVVRERIFAKQKELGVIPPDARLTPRPDAIAAWDDLSDDERRLLARQMEVYAGFVAHTDHEIGRILEAVRAADENTLVFYIVGDNGAAPGGPIGYAAGTTDAAGQLEVIDQLGGPEISDNGYATGWGWMGGTPFPGWKMMASHLGGLRNPLIVSWPGRLDASETVRTQFTHVNDVAATILEVTGIDLPDDVNGVRQSPLDGASFVATFRDPDADLGSRTQYFELFGNRGMYRDGWFASSYRDAWPWSDWSSGPIPVDSRVDAWELFHLPSDFSQSENLAERHPEIRRELTVLFHEAALDNGIYPLIEGYEALGIGKPMPPQRRRYVYTPAATRVPVTVRPRLSGRSFRILADAVIGVPESASGVILSYGGRDGGVVLYLLDGLLRFDSRPARGLAGPSETLAASAPIGAGPRRLGFEFLLEGSEGTRGRGRLTVDDRVVDEGTITGPVADWFMSGSLDIGRENGPGVSPSFAPPFAFVGDLRRVTVEIEPDARD
jgi:arylsulfatase